MARNKNPNSAKDQFYIALGHQAPGLDKSYATFGKVRAWVWGRGLWWQLGQTCLLEHQVGRGVHRIRRNDRDPVKSSLAGLKGHQSGWGQAAAKQVGTVRLNAKHVALQCC